MLDSGVEADAVCFNMVLCAYIKLCVSVEQAEALVREMEEHKVTPNAVTFNLLMNIYAREGKTSQCLRCLRQMHQDGLKADHVSFNTASKAFARSDDVLGAETLLKEMKLAGIRPDIVTYNTVIGTCAR